MWIKGWEKRTEKSRGRNENWKEVAVSVCVCVRLRQWTHVPMSVGSFAMNCSQSAFLCERPIFKTLVYLFRQFVFLIDSTVCVSCLFLSFTHFKFTCSFFWPYVFLFHRCCHLFSSHFWLNAYEEYRCNDMCVALLLLLRWTDQPLRCSSATVSVSILMYWHYAPSTITLYFYRNIIIIIT